MSIETSAHHADGKTDRLITVEETMKMTGFRSRKSIYSMISAGLLSDITIIRKRRIRLSEVEALIAGSVRQQAA